jgi:tetratricopeptide (TPR) repeat protein
MPESFADVAPIFEKMRQAKSWTQEEMAVKAGVPVDAVLAYESCPASLTSRIATRVLDAVPLMLFTDQTMLDTAAFPPGAPRLLDVEMEARVLEWKAALSIDKARFREALTTLDRALALRPWPERIGRLLLSKAEVLGEMSRERHALDALREAEGYLDVKEEPHLWLRLRIDQMYFFCHQEAYSEAEACRLEARELTDLVGRDRERWELRSLEGRIAAGLGQAQEAIGLLQGVREELLAAGRLFETSCASLDLAAVLVAQGKLAELEELARQLEPRAQEKRLSEASRTTLRLFCRLVARGSFKPEMGRRFAADFRKTDTRLTRPFELPGEQSNGNESAAVREARIQLGSSPPNPLL